MSSSIPTRSRQWTLTNQPSGKPTTEGSNPTFTLETKDLPSLKDGQILVKTQYLSNDPAQRGWISPPSQIDPKRLYVPPVPVGQPMRARGLGKVVSSKAEGFSEGDVIQGNLNWVEYAVLDVDDGSGMGPRKVMDIPGVNLTHFLGALGSTGLTAWYGTVEIGKLQKGERVVVSGAAGATGSMVVQIAKHMIGASYVVGIAGSDEKCRWVESLGADKCLNYKSKNFTKELAEACREGDENGVDFFYDNVAGTILDDMLTNLKQGGRVAACGAITGYNGETAEPMKNWFQVITMRLQVNGFIVTDWIAKGEATPTVKKLIGGVKEGKIKVGEESETVVDTKFEDVPKTWMMLFEGGNQGKLVTKFV